MQRFASRAARPFATVLRRVGPGASWLGRACLDLLFPPRCVHCDADLPSEHGALLLCGDCCRALAPEVWVGCRRCGASVMAGARAESENCRHCQNYRLHFDRVVPLGMYEGVMRDAVLKMKRPAHEALSTALGELLVQRRGDDLAALRPSVIVPVPMHWWRRFSRGVNSPEVVAARLGRCLGVPVARHALARPRNTLPQKNLLPRERFRNVRGAFRVPRGNRIPWKDSQILLVDDILTTGATCSEAARILKEAGAATVAVAVLAKAQGN